MEAFLIAIFWQAVLLLYPAWRIYRKVGLNPTISLTVLIPYLGFFICALILHYSEWQVKSAGGD